MRRLLASGLAGCLLFGGAGVAVASTEPALVAHGTTAVEGTEATAVFRVAGRTIRQVRYADRQTLVYSFSLENQSRLPVTIKGLAPLAREPRLFRYVAVRNAAGQEQFTIPAGDRTTVAVSMRMHACETLSARAGSFATEVVLHTERAGMITDVVTVEFPEEIHTGSPREAFCPHATATSRPPG